MPSPSPSASLLLRIRQAFCQCSGSVHSSIAPVELARYWQKLAEGEAKRQGRVFTATDSQAIALGVVQLVQEVDLTSTGRFTIDDWVHYMLLLSSGRATSQVNSLLKSAVQRRPRVLHDLQSTFEQMGGAKKGMVNAKDVIEMYSHKLMKLISGSLELGNRDPEQFAHEVMDALSLDTDERITYHEFVAYCLGRQKHKVCLYLYDLSNGLSESMSPRLIGTKLDAIWHSGVVVFGKEYYFSRDTMFDEAGKTGFGTPTKILELGSTLWHQEELHHFICRELKPMFHRGTYDVVLNNCNHFSDRLCMYLLGQRLPDEVLRQSSYLMQSSTIRTLRPVLNWWVRDVVVQRDTETTLQAEGLPRVDFSPGVCVTMTKDWCRPVLGVVCNGCPDANGDGNDEGTWVRYFNLCLGKAGSCRGHVCTEWVPLACLQEAKFSHYDSVYREILSAIVPDGSFELGASLKDTNVTSDNLTDTLDPDEWSVFPCEQSNVPWKSTCGVKPHAEIFL
uniref:PPPDE domain-containing protein n=1 Tax=Noctiluca scintillans TaxID=2966 RepID=A0A7S1FB10_NOCSC|mmetsp:Transcript_49419/g.131172  ORF Transcript_49419/g.131172 Transcript_49419/m.131172 type:complete len:505 (+) Transcript_49419:70-1584(+)